MISSIGWPSTESWWIVSDDRRTSRETCIAAVEHAADRLGHPPTAEEYREMGLTPTPATIQAVMGSWNAALEAAGYEPRTSSRPEGGAPRECTQNSSSGTDY